MVSWSTSQVGGSKIGELQIVSSPFQRFCVTLDSLLLSVVLTGDGYHRIRDIRVFGRR